jgi:dipeptide/tripeptide permease
MNMGAQAGGWLTAWLTPLIAKHYGWTASFLVAAALCVTGSVAWMFVDPKRTLEVTHSTADIPMTAHSLDTTVPVSKNH